MGENYVELMWRVVVKRGNWPPQLVAAFLDLETAESFAKQVGGSVWVARTEQVSH